MLRNILNKPYNEFKKLIATTERKQVLTNALSQVNTQIKFPPENEYGFFGDLSNWDEAEKLTTSYAHDEIIQKVRTSLLKVKNGLAVYERDSVLFDKIQFAWPLLAALQHVALSSEGRLEVIDFGGSLGSTYYQNRGFLSTLKKLQWNVVEQSNFVDTGKREFQDDSLKFFYNIEDCLTETPNINLLLVSSVFQYLKDPYAMLNQFLQKSIPYLIFDRTTFYEKNQDRLTLQVVPPSIYTASYLAWFLNEEKFLNLILKKYDLICDWEALGSKILIKDGETQNYGYDKGFFFKLKAGE